MPKNRQRMARAHTNMVKARSEANNYSTLQPIGSPVVLATEAERYAAIEIYNSSSLHGVLPCRRRLDHTVLGSDALTVDVLAEAQRKDPPAVEP